jgi:Mce-associated membrane protein
VASTVLYARLAAPQRFDETAAREGLQAAPGYVERVISYDYRTLERDVGDARKNLTGKFLGEYDKSMAKVTPTLVSQQAIQEAKVVKAGIQEASADEVSVLIFSQRMTTKLDRDEPLVYQDRILVTLTKVGDRWLISQMRYLV